MLYIILVTIAAIMAGATICTACKPGEKENICKYDHSTENWLYEPCGSHGALEWS